jgi:hypothetical protein
MEMLRDFYKSQLTELEQLDWLSRDMKFMLTISLMNQEDIWDTYFGSNISMDDQICQKGFALAHVGNTVLDMYPNMTISELEVLMKLQS